MERWHALDRRVRRLLLAIAIPLIVTGGVFGYWTLSPLLYDVQVSEALPTAETSGQGPTVLRQGKMRNADSVHRASGMAKLVKTTEGQRLLRFNDNFEVINGPDLYVWLTEDPEGDPDQGYHGLGRLKGNVGSQNYEIDEEVDLAKYKGVIVWCKAFSVLFGRAKLENSTN
ncbi:MAG: DM13 domain-containing protein [Candidatus Bipolaricaulia bacterium]